MEKLIYGESDVYYVGLNEGDTCPSCGGEFRHIPFFAGDISCVHKKLDPSVMDDDRIATVAYGNWVKCWGGYCSHCAETFHNNFDRLKMSALNSVKKLCIFLLTAIIGFLGFVFTEIWPFQFVMFVGTFGIIPFTFLAIADLTAYFAKKPYVEPTMEELEHNIVYACNGRMNRNMVISLLGKDQFFIPKDALIEEAKNTEEE
jgi:hypothetical protein